MTLTPPPARPGAAFVVREEQGALAIDITSGYLAALLPYAYLGAPALVVAVLLPLMFLGVSGETAALAALAVIVAVAIPIGVGAGPERVVVKDGGLWMRNGFRSFGVACEQVAAVALAAHHRGVEIHLRDGRRVLLGAGRGLRADEVAWLHQRLVRAIRRPR